jgi:hypothetical protein
MARIVAEPQVLCFESWRRGGEYFLPLPQAIQNKRLNRLSTNADAGCKAFAFFTIILIQFTQYDGCFAKNREKRQECCRNVAKAALPEVQTELALISSRATV